MQSKKKNDPVYVSQPELNPLTLYLGYPPR